jgi:DNA-binding MarR family transcriptional regulator
VNSVYFNPNSQGDTAADAPVVIQTYPSPETRAQLLTRVNALIQERARRSDHFPTELFSEPAWDILLALYAAEMAQQRVTALKLAEQVLAPTTTALRWLKVLEAVGLVDRKPDPLDARRVFLSLTPKGRYAMSSYLSEGGARCPT